ncbi:unnamed protein product [Blepharisma stoltei]|uniref:Uncharacterized protein n=1 Tax=Blepharisma stoltei TaxID=1481888 RepID=A0AAU9K173_9CILI|nr:unnamed protein product [Blepharisma stoltei]
MGCGESAQPLNSCSRHPTGVRDLEERMMALKNEYLVGASWNQVEQTLVDQPKLNLLTGFSSWGKWAKSWKEISTLPEVSFLASQEWSLLWNKKLWISNLPKVNQKISNLQWQVTYLNVRHGETNLPTADNECRHLFGSINLCEAVKVNWWVAGKH